MSYEGYEEYLCKHGHYWTVDAFFFGNEISKCPVCASEHVWTHSVDETNGIVLQDDGTPCQSTVPFKLEKEKVWDDIWKIDHYGNKYAIKIPRYKIPKAN